MDPSNIRTFRDFLTFYNLMSQTCFQHCIFNFNSRHLEQEEIDCAERCVTKLVRFNNRTINVYADIQTKLLAKRTEEMEKQEADTQKAAVAAEVTESEQSNTAE